MQSPIVQPSLRKHPVHSVLREFKSSSIMHIPQLTDIPGETEEVLVAYAPSCFLGEKSLQRLEFASFVFSGVGAGI